MADCGCGLSPAETEAQQRVLRIALALNAIMFVAEVSIGLAAHSSGLMADGLDMLADAGVYSIALAAVRRGELFKAKAAMVSGIVLLLLGAAVLLDVLRRLPAGGSPEGMWMIAVAAVALAVNATVLHLLNKQRLEGVHIRASRIFTRVDVIANIAVMVSGGVVLLTRNRYFDLVVGAGIAVYVGKEAIEILTDARRPRAAPQHRE